MGLLVGLLLFWIGIYSIFGVLYLMKHNVKHIIKTLHVELMPHSILICLGYFVSQLF